MVEVTITHHATPQGGRYSAQFEGENAGHLDWTGSGADIRIATHTLVPDARRGQGIAAKLVDALIADARREGFRILPQCPYVAAQFRRHPEWSDLRA